MRSFNNADVAFVFDGYPPKARRRLLALRELVFRTAKKTEGVGELEEVLRWGEPTYLTVKPKSGSMIRMHWREQTPDCVRMLFHCQTTLVESFRSQFPHDLQFEGNRSIVLANDQSLPVRSLEVCVAQALTYRLKKAPPS